MHRTVLLDRVVKTVIALQDELAGHRPQLLEQHQLQEEPSPPTQSPPLPLC